LVKASTIEGRTALHIAVQNGDTDMVSLLHAGGADVDAKDGSKINPLHLAAAKEHAAIARMLLKAGADPNQQGFRHNETALHVAAVHGSERVAEILLSHGADPQVVNLHGQTPADLALKYGHTNITVVIEQFARKSTR
jgi:ankyrin repeat protein